MSVVYFHINFLGILFSRNRGTFCCLTAVILLHGRIIILSFLCIFFGCHLFSYQVVAFFPRTTGGNNNDKMEY
jgi:hypothetical protein